MGARGGRKEGISDSRGRLAPARAAAGRPPRARARGETQAAAQERGGYLTQSVRGQLTLGARSPPP